MKLKKGILAGICAMVVSGVASVGYSATQQEICKNMWDPFQSMRAVTGLMDLTAEQSAQVSKDAAVILAGAKDSHDSISVDKNYKVLNDEVTYHAANIDAAAKASDLEEIQVQFRRMTIACRNCHKIYKSEQRLVP
ncbi:MAG: cytochrome c [Candidatus Kuenenia sp.]|nr:cytochrome c [Candidatus Kuenenia hertensis]